MSRMKLLFATALASAFVFLGGAVAPVVAFADESVEGVETSEIVSVEEFVEETESVENTANDEVVEDKEITYDDILALMGNIAEKEGFKNEWDKTLYYLETAASEKKVDTMILLTALVLAFLTIYATVKIVKYKFSKAKVAKIINSITGAETNGNAQTKAINGLIDEEEKIEKTLEEHAEKDKALALGMEKLGNALRCFLRGVKIDQSLKDEAFRSLNEADESFDVAKK